MCVFLCVFCVYLFPCVLQELPCVGGELDEKTRSWWNVWRMAGCGSHPPGEECWWVAALNSLMKTNLFFCKCLKLWCKNKKSSFLPPGIYVCGPCPVAAIQQRCLKAPYDAPFIYASVDADVIRLIVRNGLVVGRKVDSECVGALIYTKGIGTDKPENLTNSYKMKSKREWEILIFMPVTVSGRYCTYLHHET